MCECERASWERGKFFSHFIRHSFLFSLSLSPASERERRKEKEEQTRAPNMSGRPEPPAAKRPRSTRPGSAISGSGGKLGGGLGIGGGTANAAVKSKLMEFGIGQKAIDSASTTPPALFFYSNLHDAVRAELQALLRSVDDASRAQSSVTEGGKVDGEGVASATKTTNASASLPQTARARALADVASRARLLERVHAYHSAVEDEVNMIGMRERKAWLEDDANHERDGKRKKKRLCTARATSSNNQKNSRLIFL